MAYQLSRDGLRQEVIDLTVPSDPSIAVPKQGEEEVSVSSKDVGVFAEVLSNYLLHLRDGEDPRSTLLRWSELINPNLHVWPDHMQNLMKHVVQTNIRDAKHLVEMLETGSGRFSDSEVEEFREAMKRLVEPIGRYESRHPVVTYKGATLEVPFKGPLARHACDYANQHMSRKFPQNGNLSFAPIRGTQALVDGMLEHRYSEQTQNEMMRDQYKLAIVARAFYDGIREVEKLDSDGARPSALRTLRVLMDDIGTSGTDPALLLGALLSRKQQCSFGISALGTLLSVQIPWTDRLCLAIIRELTEAWQSAKGEPRGIVTTARVDGNLVLNLVDHIKTQKAFEHYDCAVVMYRHTDQIIFVYDYDTITQKLIFVTHATCELTLEHLEGIPGAVVYHCSRGHDGKLKAGSTLNFPQTQNKMLATLSSYLRHISRAIGWDVPGSLIPRILHIEDITAQLGKNPADMGCWKRMINGDPARPTDVDKLMDASEIEVLALLSLWYKYPNHFQFDFEAVTLKTILPSLTSMLAHVSHADSRSLDGKGPVALACDTAHVTVIANRNHPLWTRRFLWGSLSL